MSTPISERAADLVAANRILFQVGVVDGFGHVSVRHEARPDRFLLARSMAPGLVTADDIMEFDLDGSPIDPRGRAVYLERFIHGEIYRARPEVQSVVHSHSPNVIPFGVTPTRLQPIYHMSGFLGAGVPVFDIRRVAGDTDMLVTSGALGKALAETLADKSVALMRGHGSVAVGTSIQQAVYRAFYTEMNAKLQAEAMKLGPVTFLSDEEAAKAMASNDKSLLRPWELWKRQAMGEK
jgi:HCOMODA/2-hydroxy-3-carboxy-muconic semialdehyde decarboxylase